MVFPSQGPSLSQEQQPAAMGEQSFTSQLARAVAANQDTMGDGFNDWGSDPFLGQTWDTQSLFGSEPAEDLVPVAENPQQQGLAQPVAPTSQATQSGFTGLTNFGQPDKLPSYPLLNVAPFGQPSSPPGALSSSAGSLDSGSAPTGFNSGSQHSDWSQETVYDNTDLALNAAALGYSAATVPKLGQDNYTSPAEGMVSQWLRHTSDEQPASDPRYSRSGHRRSTLGQDQDQDQPMDRNARPSRRGKKVAKKVCRRCKRTKKRCEALPNEPCSECIKADDECFRDGIDKREKEHRQNRQAGPTTLPLSVPDNDPIPVPVFGHPGAAPNQGYPEDCFPEQYRVYL